VGVVAAALSAIKIAQLRGNRFKS